MIRFLTFCAGMALIWVPFFAGAMAASAPECPLTQLASLKFDTMPDGRIAIPVTVEDHPLSFMVDTGGITPTINWEQAKNFGLAVKQTSRRLVGVAGSSMNAYVILNSFSVGGLHGKGLPMYIEERGLHGADGTFAPDMLKGYDVDIDFAHGTFNLFSQDHCPGKVVYWTKTGYVVVRMDLARNGHVRVPVTIDGKKIMATLDTGAVMSLIGMKAAADLGIEKNTPGLKLIGDANGYQAYTYPFHWLDFGGVSVANPHIAITTDNFTKGLGSDLILGVGVLRQLHLYIAYDEEKLYITAAEAN
jgi:predicted aspartyl protease